MANEGTAILLMMALGIAGILITLNILPESLGLGFNSITGFISGLWILVARFIVGPILTLLSIFVIIGIARG